MKNNDLEQLFLRFRDQNDMRALAGLFDVAAPQLMAVAAHLATRRDEADDLTQATFLTAIERAASYEPGRPVLPWLLGILALHAQKLRAKHSRAFDVERVHQPDGDDPERIAAGAEVRNAVDAACRGLPETYSTIVRRHLVEGLEPIELARQLGLSSGAARVRLHRGLKLLRNALPVAFASGAYAATTSRGIASIRSAVLERASLLTGSPIPAAGFAPLTVLLLFLAPLFVAVPALLIWRSQTTTELAQPALAAAPAPVTTASEPAANSPAPVATERVAAESSASNNEPPSSSHGALVSNAIVRGRLLLPNGSPAVGASAKLRGFEANEERARAFGLPADWHDPELQHADANGQFAFAFDPPRAFQFALDVECEHAANAAWRWHELAPGSTLDLGDIALEMPARIVARIVDAQANALCAGWTVRVNAPALTSAQGRVPAISSVKCASGSTQFVVDHLPARAVDVSATTSSGARIEPVAIALTANETKQVDLAYAGPDLTRRITVVMRTGPFGLFGDNTLNVLVSRPGMTPRNAAFVEFSADHYVVDDLEPGAYDLEINDPRFVPWSKSGVHSGEVVQAKLVASSAVRLHLVRADGQPYTGNFVLRAQLSARNGQSVSMSAEVTLLGADQEPPPSNLFAGLLSGDLALTLEIPNAMTQKTQVLALAPGETRDVTVSLAGAAGLSGLVLASDETTALAGVDVQLTQGNRPGHTAGPNALIAVERDVVPSIHARTTSDAQGRFSFPGLAAGEWTLRATWGKYLHLDRTFTLAAQTSPIELVQPAHGSLAGHLLIPAGAALADALLTLSWSTPDPAGSDMRMDRDTSELLEDGSFHFGPLPTGELTVRFMVSTALPSGSTTSSGWTTSASVDIATLVIHDGEETQAELDARAMYPGRLRAHVAIDGHSASNGFVQCRPEGATAPGSIGRAVDLDGIALLGAVTPGVYRVTYAAQNETWSWLTPQTVTIVAGQQEELEIELHTTTRDLRCVDIAGGAVFANTEVEWRTGLAGHELEAHAKTDAQGLLHLKMPEQNIQVRCVNDMGPFKTIAWSAGSGPLTVALRRVP